MYVLIIIIFINVNIASKSSLINLNFTVINFINLIISFIIITITCTADFTVIILRITNMVNFITLT
jgi:hypothetical protein